MPPASPPGRRPPLELGRGVRFDPPLLLAPMEGVTDRSFRDLVIAASGPGALGAACTEFLRISQLPLTAARASRELGPPRPGIVVGAQLMGNDPELLAVSALEAAAAGAAFVDLNFGCPASRVFRHGAGSALLADPPRLQALVRSAAAACPVPVTVKIRAGIEHDHDLEEIARRVEEAGAAALTVHARLKAESYRLPADWRRIVRAVSAVSIPVIGNGGAGDARRARAMFAETGCAAVMIGRGALGNPWIFRDLADLQAGRVPMKKTSARVGAWLERYAVCMAAGGATPLQVSGRLKQALKAMLAQGLLPAEAALQPALRETEPGRLLAAVGLGGAVAPKA